MLTPQYYAYKLTDSGFNGLQGFDMINPKFNLSAAPGEPNMLGTAVFSNSTIVAVELVGIPINNQRFLQKLRHTNRAM